MTGHVTPQLEQVQVVGQWLGLDQYELHLMTGRKLCGVGVCGCVWVCVVWVCANVWVCAQV